MSGDTVQALLLAVVQGITELFPVSSLGHAVVLPHLLGWTLDQNSESFLPYLVALHIGTALALLLYFWADWWALLRGLGGPSMDPDYREHRRLLWLLVVGTVPAGILGLILQKSLASLFSNFRLAAVFLILNGALLVAGEFLRRRKLRQDLTGLTMWQAAAIGTAQTIALLPGFSRSGASMVGGLLVGLKHEAAARFSYLLATPIILAAGVLELPKLAEPALRPELGTAVLGAVIAGVLAYLSTVFLMRYFRRSEVNALIPFGAYCALLGVLTLVVGH